MNQPAPLPAALQRPYKDLDYVVRRADAARWRDLLDGHGYTADARFNALHGAQRLLHYDPANERQLDTFVSSFAMCHALDLEDQPGAGQPGGGADRAAHHDTGHRAQVTEMAGPGQGGPAGALV